MINQEVLYMLSKIHSMSDKDLLSLGNSQNWEDTKMYSPTIPKEDYWQYLYAELSSRGISTD